MALPRNLGRLPHLRKVWVIREIFFRLLACRRHTTLPFISQESAYPAGSSITQPTLTAFLNGEGNVAFWPQSGHGLFSYLLLGQTPILR